MRLQLQLPALITILLACPVSAQNLTTKLLSPDGAAVAKASTEIDRLFAADLKQANSAAARSALAAKILGLANDVKEQPPTRWALYVKAREIAVTGGDVPTALKAVADQTAIFAMDAGLVQVDTVDRLAKINGNRALLDAISPMMEAAIAADDYETAGKLGLIGLRLCEKLREVPTKARLEVVLKRSKDLKSIFDSLSDETAKGKFFAFSKGDWTRGLPLLAKAGGDLATVARKDLTNPAEGRADLGDAWFELAEKAAGVERVGMMKRALFWWRTGEEKSGLEKVKLEAKATKASEAIERDDIANGLFSRMAGKWAFKYKSGHTFEYSITPSGAITFDVWVEPDGKRLPPPDVYRRSQLYRSGGKIYANFNDREIIEHLTITPLGCLADRYLAKDFPSKVANSGVGKPIP
jgi:hypothetical protein